MAPRVSVLTTLFNCRRFIGQAIGSILQQSLRDLEVVVCDDASTDGSADIVAELAASDDRVRLVRHPVNLGGTAAVRSCVRHARGKYFAILESDDLALPGRLGRQADWLDAHPDADAVFGGVQLIGESGEPLDPADPFHGVFAQQDQSREAWLRQFFTGGNCLCWSSVMYRPEMYARIGPERPAFQFLPDFDLWVRLALDGSFHLLPDKVTAYRRLSGQGNLSAVTPGRLAAIAMEQSVILRHFERPDAIEAVTGLSGGNAAARLAMARAALAVPSQAHRHFAMQLLLETGLDDSAAAEAIAFLAAARPLLREADVFQKLKVARLRAERDKYRERAETARRKKPSP
jgi:glycosyltransferase involved in cell wall biosynthesis